MASKVANRLQKNSIIPTTQYSKFREFIGLLQLQQLRNYEFNMNLNDFPTYNYKHKFMTLYSPSIILHSYLLTYLLTTRSTVLLENLTGSQVGKKLPAFYGTRRFITAFISAHHLSLS